MCTHSTNQLAHALCDVVAREKFTAGAPMMKWNKFYTLYYVLPIRHFVPSSLSSKTARTSTKFNAQQVIPCTNHAQSQSHMIMHPITDKPRPRKYNNWSSSQAIQSKDRKSRQDSPSTLTWVTLARIAWIIKAPGNRVTDPTPDLTIAILPVVIGSHVWGVINYAKKNLVY